MREFLLAVGLTLFGSWSLFKVSKMFLIHVIFLSCASEIPFSNLPSPVEKPSMHENIR